MAEALLEYIIPDVQEYMDEHSEIAIAMIALKADSHDSIDIKMGSNVSALFYKRDASHLVNEAEVLEYAEQTRRQLESQFPEETKLALVGRLVGCRAVLAAGEELGME